MRRAPSTMVLSGIDELTARAASQLPRLTLDDLAACRRHLVTTPLTSCVNIANAGTGASSLEAAFAGEPTLSADRDHRVRIENTDRHGKKFASYSSHALAVADLKRWFIAPRERFARAHRDFSTPPRQVNCFVMSVRDPAERFESAFRYSYAHHERLVASLSLPRQNRTAGAIVERLREPLAYGAPPSLFLSGRLQNVSGPAFLYAHSAGQPDWGVRVSNYPGPNNGSQFLISQWHYLRGLNCSAGDEVHFICTERFDTDFRRFLSAFGLSPSVNGSSWHRQHRSAARSKLAYYAERRSHLSEADRAFVRERLYPWDTELHRWACGRNRSDHAVEKV